MNAHPAMNGIEMNPNSSTYRAVQGTLLLHDPPTGAEDPLPEWARTRHTDAGILV